MYPKGNLFIPAAVGQLEAIIKEPTNPPKGVALVCHPHPLGGGTMHNKVVFRAAAGLVDAGLITLRFNFRGVGASDGEHDGHAETTDVRDCLDYLTQHYPDLEITLAGFSFGSRMGSEVALHDERIKRVIMIGTPVDKYDDFGYLTEMRQPMLFVHGDRDEFGALVNLRELFDRVATSTNAELVTFDNCGHFFDEHLAELRQAIADWTNRQIHI